MYTYKFLVSKPPSVTNSPLWCSPNAIGETVPVRPGPDEEIPTMEALRERVRHDIGFVPDWLADCPPGEYIGVEDEHEIEGVWFTVVIEGSEEHKLPSVAHMIAWARNRGYEPVW